MVIQSLLMCLVSFAPFIPSSLSDLLPLSLSLSWSSSLSFSSFLPFISSLFLPSLSLSLLSLPTFLSLSMSLSLSLSVLCHLQLLMLSNQCTHLTNSEKVLFALKQHYGLVHQYSTSAFTATLFHNRKESMLLWKCVYSAVNMKKYSLI